jgi:sortase A
MSERSDQPELNQRTAPGKSGKKNFRRVLTRILVIAAFALIFLTGICVLLYPSMSEYINAKNQSRVIDTYENNVKDLTPADYSAWWKAAQAYNARLASSGQSLQDAFSTQKQDTSADRSGEYWNLLNVNGDGVMGFITIDKVGIKLPIYHGTGEDALAQGVGHVEGTSLPVGGEATHAVLSAHTGLPSAELFTNVDQLREGDTFQLHILDQVLTYKIDQILTVLPDEVDSLRLVPGEDYVTLVTCTPYGINDHRLLIRGARIPTPETEKTAAVTEQQQTTVKMNGFQRFIHKVFVAFTNIFEAIVTFFVKASERVMDLFGVAY